MNFLDGRRYEHGTRARYVAGCRCDACRAANTARDRRRRAEIAALASDVVPTGPPIPGKMLRGGREVRVRRCPGANGAKCIREVPTCLRGTRGFCRGCLERATVWDGLIDAAPVRDHMLRLRELGVGYVAVAEASDTRSALLAEVVSGKQPRIRAQSARRVLEVDAGAIADGALVDASRANEQIAELLAGGFTSRHLAELMGYASGQPLQLGKRDRMTAGSALRVDRLWRSVARGDVVPHRSLVDVTEEARALLALIDAGLTFAWLGKRLGFRQSVLTRRKLAAERVRMTPVRAGAVRAFLEQVEKIRRDGTGPPEDWKWPGSALQRLGAGFGYGGGYLVRSAARPRSEPRG